MQIYNSYVAIRKYVGNGLTNQAQVVPYGALCRVVVDQGQGYIVYRNRRICSVDSQVSLDYFTQNDDKNGKKRGDLTKAIMKALNFLPESEEEDRTKDERWDRVWADKMCHKYRRHDITNHWLWSYDFFNAPIIDLQYIVNLVNAT